MARLSFLGAASVAALLLAAPAYADAERIVSVGGSTTEIVYALGAEQQLVGTDSTSFYPPAAPP